MTNNLPLSTKTYLLMVTSSPLHNALLAFPISRHNPNFCLHSFSPQSQRSTTKQLPRLYQHPKTTAAAAHAGSPSPREFGRAHAPFGSSSLQICEATPKPSPMPPALAPPRLGNSDAPTLHSDQAHCKFARRSLNHRQCPPHWLPLASGIRTRPRSIRIKRSPNSRGEGAGGVRSKHQSNEN